MTSPTSPSRINVGAAPRRGLADTLRHGRLAHYARLTRLHRPVGWMLLLWPTLWALWIAGAGRPDPFVVAVFVAGVLVMRSAGCILNDLADRRFDGAVKRTRDRPLVTGAVQPREAALLAVVLLLVALGLVLTLNRLTVLLAVAGLGWAAIYPFMKRYTYFPQVFLGFAFGWGVPMAFAALTGTVTQLGWLVFTVNLVWVLIYDTQYAMVDRDDDLRIGVKSTALLFEESDRAILGVLQVLLVIGLLLVGGQAGRGVPWLLGVVAVAGYSAWQQYLIRERDRDGCFRAFRNNNWLGGTVFVALVLDYYVNPVTG